MPSERRLPSLIYGLSLLLLVLSIWIGWAGGQNVPEAAATPSEAFDAPRWRAAFARPDAIPMATDGLTTPERVELGRRLFNDTRLSGSNGVACASCHQPELSFSDGIARRRGLMGEPLARRTQPLWNLAWGLTFFWDGRAKSLEDQTSFPIENRHEMGGSLPETARELRADPEMRAVFAGAFPGEAEPVTAGNIAKSLADFERTLVSPPTRFDRWAIGDDDALTTNEFAGLKLFVGPAGCVGCHKGWRFTDEAFHDIGLPTGTPADRGRGAVLSASAIDHAFKTPSLRERVWTAPYMHDGSLASLDDVLDHYARGIVRRPTLSRDLPAALALNPEESEQLLAFLGTLSSDDPPRPAAVAFGLSVPKDAGPIQVATTLVGQKNREFTPAAVAIRAGEALTIVNDDTRTHTVSVAHPRMTFTSDAQEPGDRVVLPFPNGGEFEVVCGIHPEMRLRVTVSEAAQ